MDSGICQTSTASPAEPGGLSTDYAGVIRKGVDQLSSARRSASNICLPCW